MEGKGGEIHSDASTAERGKGKQLVEEHGSSPSPHHSAFLHWIKSGLWDYLHAIKI